MDNERICVTGQPRAVSLAYLNTALLSEVCEKSFISPFIDEKRSPCQRILHINTKQKIIQHKNKQHISLSASLAALSSSLLALKTAESQGKFFIVLLLIGLRLETGLYRTVSFLLALQ